MADAIQTLPNSKNDLIVSAVQKNLIEKSVLAGTVRDVSAFAVKGAKAFQVPKLSNFSVTNRGFGASADATALTDSSDTINLDFNAYIAYLFDSRDNYQSSIEYQVEAAMRASLAHAKNVDQQILSTIDAVADVEVSAATFTTVKEQVLELRRQLLQNGADIARMTIAIGVDKEAEMLAESDFVRADFYGSANVRTGQIGQLYGIPVVISRLITGDEMKMYDADGIGLAFQGGVEMSEQDANEYGASSKRVAMDQVFGTGGLELGEQGATPLTSPLVGKLVA
jgi:hypothetical protein